MARAFPLCALALVLLASLAAGQVPPVGVPPTDTTVPGGNAADYAAADAADSTGDYAPSSGSGDYAPPAPDDFAPAPPTDGTDPSATDDSSASGDYAPPDPTSTDTTTDPAAPSEEYPPAPPGELPSKQDPATSGCRNEYHIIVASTDECTQFCDRKIDRAQGQATVEPEVYESKLGAGTCCNCNYERTPGVINPNYVPDDKGSDETDTSGNLAGGGTSSTTSPPAGELPSSLDPAEFKPPTEEELMAAVDPTYVYPTNSKETNTYAVLRVTGGPFTLPLPFDQVLDFIYAFNNITGVAWQYKGDAPSVPEQYPAAPYGVPQVRNGPPPLPAPAASPPPAPVVISTPPPPVVDPLAAVPPPAPIDPATGLPLAPVDPSLAVPPPAPTFDPAAGAVPPPVDPNAVAGVPPPPAVFDPAAGGVPPADGSVPGITLPGTPPAAPAFRRRLMSSFRRPARRFLQDGGNGNYDFSPMQGYSPPPNPDTGNTDNTDNTDNSGNQDVGVDPLQYDGAAPPAPDTGGNSGDYNNGDTGGNGEYSPPAPEDAYGTPPSDGSYSPPEGAYTPPEGAYTPPSPETVYSPPPVAPSPPPPEPPGLSAPPLPPATALPPNMDGIWYFSMYPLTDSKFLSMAVALNEATGDGNSAFLNFLTSAGIPATGVELRYIGQASEGQIDLTKRLDGDIFGAATATAAAAADEGDSMSTATIAAIVGGVVGGVLLIALAGIMVASNRRKSSKVQKEQLSQRWAMERELVDAEKVKLDSSAASGGAAYGGGGSQSRINPAHTAGFVAMTSRDLDQQRSMRRAQTMAAEARLSTLEPGVQPSPLADPKPAGGTTPKPSRLESMRSALGLSKKGSGVSKPSGGGSSAGAGSGSPVPAWTDSPTGGARAAGSPATPTLRMQYSMTGTTPTRAASSSNADASDAPSPWGRMFKK